MLRDVKTKMTLFNELRDGKIRGTFLDLIVARE